MLPSLRTVVSLSRTVVDESDGDGPGRRFRRRVVSHLLAIPGSGAGTGVVDIGAGAGHLALLLRRQHPSTRLLGLEPDAAAVTAARRRVPDALFRHEDLVDGAPPPTDLYAWATHAVCCEALGRVDEPEKLLWNARAYLAPGCRVVVTVTPGRRPDRGPGPDADPGRGHDHDPAPRIATAADLHRLLEQSGLDVELVTGVGFPSYNLLRAGERARGRELFDRDAHGSLPGQLAVWTADALLAWGPGRGRSRFGGLIVAVAHEPR